MKKVVFLCALALVAGAVVLRLLQHDSGYVLIVIAGKTIEMRFWFAVLFVVVSGGLASVFILFLLRIIRGVSNGWSMALASRARRGAMRTNSGFIQYIEGDWLGAQKSLLKAAKDVKEPLLHYLAAARGAYETGDFVKAETLIEKAKETSNDNPLAIAISQARMLFLSGKYGECLSTLHQAKTTAPSHPVVLSLLQKTYSAVGDWPSLEAILPLLERSQVMSVNEFEHLQQSVYCQLLEAENHQKPLLLDGGAPSPDEKALEEPKLQLSGLDTVWQRVPKRLKQSSEMLSVYVQLLISVQRHDEAEQLLRPYLKKQWVDSLVGLYGLLSPQNSKAQLRAAESWLKQNPDSAILHLTLGRICLRNALWGQAKDYFLSSLNLKPTSTTYAELARLQRALGEQENSNQSYQQGLLHTVNDLPSLPLPA